MHDQSHYVAGMMAVNVFLNSDYLVSGWKLGFDIGRTIEITPSEGKLVIEAGENKYKRAAQ